MPASAPESEMGVGIQNIDTSFILNHSMLLINFILTWNLELEDKMADSGHSRRTKVDDSQDSSTASIIPQTYLN